VLDLSKTDKVPADNQPRSKKARGSPISRMAAISAGVESLTGACPWRRSRRRLLLLGPGIVASGPGKTAGRLFKEKCTFSDQNGKRPRSRQRA